MDEGSRIYRPRCNLPMHATTMPCSGKKNQGSAGRRTSPKDVRRVVGTFRSSSSQGGRTGKEQDKSLGRDARGFLMLGESQGSPRTDRGGSILDKRPARRYQHP
jgi:hypothetical protein